MRHRTGRILLIVLLFALFAGAIPAARWLLVDHRYFRDQFEAEPHLGLDRATEILGVEVFWRFRGHQLISRRSWYVSTGTLHQEARDEWVTTWRPDGRIYDQWDATPTGTSTQKSTGPWWGGVVNESRPSAPWVEGGLSPEEWWEIVAE